MDPDGLHLIAKRGKAQFAAPVPIKDIIEGKTVRFTFGPPEEYSEGNSSDEERVDSNDNLEDNGLDSDFNLMKVCPCFHNLDDPLWVGVQEDGLVKKRIIKTGVISVPLDVMVCFTYIGYIEGDTVPFDAAHIVKPKTSFLDGDVIPGLRMGLSSMMVGEAAQIFVPPPFGFGELGCPDRIPAGVNIVFIVHLKQFIPREKFQNPLFMTEEELQVADFREIIKAVKGLSKEANQQLVSKNFEMALKKYDKGEKILENRWTATEKENLDREKILGTLYLNKSKAFLELQEAKKGIREGEKYLKLGHSPQKFKALYRIAEAHLLLGNFDLALKYCKESSVDPLNEGANDVKLTELKREINRAAAKAKKVEKNQCKRMFQPRST